MTSSHLRQRIKVFLIYLSDDWNKEYLTLPFSMSDLSEHLGADRSALYREIARLKEEGFLEWDGRDIHIIDNDF